MRFFKNCIVAISVLVLFFITVNPVPVYAQTSSQPTQAETPVYQNVQQSVENFLCTPGGDGRDLERCINKLYRFGVAAGAVMLVFFVVFAGYMYITGGEKGKASAKGIIRNVLVGMALLLGSYVILRFVNPDLVIIKPIQPPIFTADDLPSCEAVGLGVNCVVSDGGDETGAATWGERISCPAGQLVSAKGLGLPTKEADEQICKPFGEKLLGLKSQLSGIAWRITDTIGTGHESSCHKPNNPLSGTCADIGIEPQDRTDENWNKLCKAISSISQLQAVNEVIGAGTRLPDCPKEADYKRSGSNVHINWRNGSGGGTGTSSGGGSKPYCIAVQEFLCDHPSGYPGTYPAYPNKEATTSSDPEIQANINLVLSRVKDLQKKHPGVAILQLYRPHQYGAHMRSVFEAGALLKGMSESEVKSRGFYCTGSIQYVKKSDVQNLNAAAKAYIDKHWAQHAMSTASSYDTTCLSDHGFGYGVDLSNATSDAVERDAEAVGLCHNLPGDTNHYVLKEKNRNNKGCNW